MTAEISLPDCSSCGSPAAVYSVMKITDYAQVRLCPLCAPPALRSLADQLEAFNAQFDDEAGVITTEPAQAPDGTPGPAGQE